MLADSSHFESDFFANTLHQLIPATSKKMNERFASHIVTALQHNKPVVLNNELITRARQQFNSLTKEELAFVILKNMAGNNADDPLKLETNADSFSVFISKDISQQIPSIFTARKFQDISTQQIPIAAFESLQGNHVLGKPDILSNEATISALTEQVRSRYIANYVDIWESLLANLKLNLPHDLGQMDAMIVKLTGSASPLLQILQTIKENTAFPPIISASPKFQELTQLLANANNNQENTLYQIFVSLNQLHFYIQGVLTASQPEKAAFEAAKTRLQHTATDPIAQLRLLAEQNSEPMKSWLNNIASQSWGFILQGAARYIEDAWHINIFTVYHSQFANSKQIDLPQFADFISQQGALANFYAFYLKPFTNNSDKSLQWRTVDNQKLPFTNDVLDQFQRVAKLQQALLTNNKAKNKGKVNSLIGQIQQIKLPEYLSEKSFS